MSTQLIYGNSSRLEATCFWPTKQLIAHLAALHGCCLSSHRPRTPLSMSICHCQLPSSKQYTGQHTDVLLMQEFRAWTQNYSDLILPRPRPQCPAATTKASKQGSLLNVPSAPSIMLHGTGCIAPELMQVYEEAAAKASTAMQSGEGCLGCWFE